MCSSDLFRRGELGVNTIAIHTGFIREQRQAWNLGEMLGLSGLASLAPLCAYLVGTGAWVIAAVRRQGGAATS